MNKEKNKAWLILAALFDIPEYCLSNSFYNIYTDCELKDIQNKGIYIVYKHKLYNTICLPKCSNHFFYVKGNNIYSIYFIKTNTENDILYSLLKSIGSKAISKDILCKIAYKYKKFIDSTFSDVLTYDNFRLVLNEESLE